MRIWGSDPSSLALLRRLLLERRAFMTMRKRLFLVLDDLAVELVYESVDRGVHVVRGGLAENVAAAHVHRGFDLLLQLLDGHDHVHIDDVMEVVGDARKLRSNVLG